MSTTAMRTAMLEALALVHPSGPTIKTTLENGAIYEPAGDVAYQAVHFLFPRAEHQENSRGYRQAGSMRVSLCYPTEEGAAPAGERAEMIRAAFYRARSIPAAGGLVINIDEAPEIEEGETQMTRYVVPVRVRFWADIPPA